MSIDIVRAEDALQHLIAEAAKVEPLRAENQHLREILAKAPNAAALAAVHEAMSASPVPHAPPDCDLAGWIRYAVRCWRSEREGANHLADLCQAAHDVLTAVGAPPDGTPAKRIETLYSALSAQLHEASDARTRLVDNADWVIQALARANKLRAKDTWHQDAAGVIREFSAVLSRLTEAENEIDDCCRILHVSGDRDLRAVVTDLMRELEERRCAAICSGEGGLQASPTVQPAGEALPPLAEARIEAMAREIAALKNKVARIERYLPYPSPDTIEATIAKTLGEKA